MRPIGFYVHYHGRGHRNRTIAIVNQMRSGRPVAVLTSRMGDLDWPAPVDTAIDLACDIDDVPEAGEATREDVPAFHYAPLHTPTIRRRVAQLAGWFDVADPAALVVDVSAEVALLARLASVPTVVMRQHGDRRDTAHEMAYRSASRLLAPFPESMEDDITPGWVRDKTVYASGFCRYADPAPSVEHARSQLGWDRPHVVVMSGRGGEGSSLPDVAAAARATPEVTWVIIGLVNDHASGDGLPGNIVIPGWIDDPLPYLVAADVVVSAGGHNSVMELAHARARAIIIPEPRPFEEQVRKAAILKRDGLAIVRDAWPSPGDWPALLDDAAAIDRSRWQPLTEGNGAATLAAAIEEVAAASDAVE